METFWVIIAVLAILAMLGACEVPVGIALAMAGAAGLLMLKSPGVVESTLGATPFSTTASYALVIIPMFILMGHLAMHAGVAADLFNLTHRYLRWMPGGLGVAAILACGGFAAVTGSSVATAVTVGKVAIGEMEKRGYRLNIAAGLVAAGGTLGVLIPPSILLVIYGMLSGESIGSLMLAGLLPGLLSIAVFAAGTILLALSGRLMVDGTWSKTPVHRVTGRDLRREVASLCYVLALVGTILIGLYTGIFTATESGAVMALLALMFLVVRTGRRPRQFLSGLIDSLRETAATTSMIFVLVVGGAIFAIFLVTLRITNDAVDLVIDLSLPVPLLVIVFLLIMIPLDMFLDPISIMLITIPLMFPVLDALGVNGIWFGILVVKVMEIGLLTPPAGINVFVVAGLHPKLTIEGVFRGVTPFIVMDLVTVTLLFIFPDIITWLPDAARG